MKKILCAVISVFMCVGVNTSVFANEIESVNRRYVEDSKTVSIYSCPAISEPMTYYEMKDRFEENSDYSQEQIRELFPISENARAVNGKTYRTLSYPLKVTDSYHPHLDFYCETSEYGNYWGIKSIYSIQLVRSYKGISKQFSGDVQAWLRSGYQIEYVVNGDFFNNGTTSCTATTGASAGLNELASVSYSSSISNSSNHYKYFYDHHTIAFQN